MSGAVTTIPLRQARALIAVTLLVTGAMATTAQAAGPLTICHAGSLQQAFNVVEKEFSARHPEVEIKDVSGGSVALAARLAAGLQPCDVFAAADDLDIDLLLKPAGLADYTITFATGRMVLAYLATDPVTRGVAAEGAFAPPASIPNAAPDWYRAVLQPGVRIAGSHPFLDPSGYRSHMMFQLAQMHYQVPNLANLLLEHYTIIPAAPPGGAAAGPALGRDFNFQFSYEHSAAAAARSNPAYRYVALPDRIDLSNAANDRYYAEAAVTVPGLAGVKSSVTIPAARVAWGLTIPLKSPNPDDALAFVALLLGRTGTAAFNANGPAPLAPAQVSARDHARLPKSLQSLVRAAATMPRTSVRP